jgi:hypothetical protein
MSSFNGRDLFGSGPHRITAGVVGELVVDNFRLGRPGSGSTPLGPLELNVVVTGRLIAPAPSALWNLREAIETLLESPPIAGTLTDGNGRAFENMSFIRFEPLGPVEFSRVASLSYMALFRRFVLA